MRAGLAGDIIAADLGGLENLENDGAGGFYVTGIIEGDLLHVDGDGKVTTIHTVLRVPLDALHSPTTVATVPDGPLPGLDDLDATASGLAFVAGDYSGSVYQVVTTPPAASAHPPPSTSPHLSPADRIASVAQQRVDDGEGAAASPARGPTR